MKKIFISYSRRDSLIADTLARKLDKDGYQIWIDRESIYGGGQWREQIVLAVESADFFLLLMSPFSLASDNVRKELDLAEQIELQVFPLIVQPIQFIPPKMRYQLIGTQQIDFVSSFESGYDKLLVALNLSERHDPVAHKVNQSKEIIDRLVSMDYNGAINILRPVLTGECSAETHLYYAIALLAQKSFNMLSPYERNEIEKHLKLAREKAPNLVLSEIILSIIEIDYYEKHGMVSNNNVLIEDKLPKIQTNLLSDEMQKILRLMKVSKVAKETLGFDF